MPPGARAMPALHAGKGTAAQLGPHFSDHDLRTQNALARAAHFQHRLLLTLDALDALQAAHADELASAARARQALDVQNEHARAAARRAEEERDELRDAVVALVDKVEREDQYGAWAPARLRTTSLVVPLKSQAQGPLTPDPVSSSAPHAATLLITLRSELDAERTAHAETLHTASAAITALQARVALREAELAACAAHPDHGALLAAAAVGDVARSGADAGGKLKAKAKAGMDTGNGNVRSKEPLGGAEMARVLDAAARTNAALTMEICALAEQVEQLQVSAARLGALSPSPPAAAAPPSDSASSPSTPMQTVHRAPHAPPPASAPALIAQPFAADSDTSTLDARSDVSFELERELRTPSASSAHSFSPGGRSPVPASFSADSDALHLPDPSDTSFSVSPLHFDLGSARPQVLEKDIASPPAPAAGFETGHDVFGASLSGAASDWDGTQSRADPDRDRDELHRLRASEHALRAALAQARDELARHRECARERERDSEKEMDIASSPTLYTSDARDRERAGLVDPPLEGAREQEQAQPGGLGPGPGHGDEDGGERPMDLATPLVETAFLPTPFPFPSPDPFEFPVDDTDDEDADDEDADGAAGDGDCALGVRREEKDEDEGGELWAASDAAPSPFLLPPSAPLGLPSASSLVLPVSFVLPGPHSSHSGDRGFGHELEQQHQYDFQVERQRTHDLAHDHDLELAHDLAHDHEPEAGSEADWDADPSVTLFPVPGTGAEAGGSVASWSEAWSESESGFDTEASASEDEGGDGEGEGEGVWVGEEDTPPAHSHAPAYQRASRSEDAHAEVALELDGAKDVLMDDEGSTDRSASRVA